MYDSGALFISQPVAVGYYVRSPSTHSHANSAAATDLIQSNSPTRPENHIEDSRFTLSRYSSSHGSNNDENSSRKIMCVRDLVVDGDDEYGDYDVGEVYHHGKRKRGCYGKYFSLRNSSSGLWICLQISWRFLLSLGAALLVFYISTKPPTPKFTIEMAGISQFGLGEGVDTTGIPTKILSCNCSIDLVIDNKSKIFGLHIHPPIVEMSFGLIPFVVSQGSKLYAETYGSTLFKLYAGTKNKPMYGAGRSMQDMLDSKRGLPLAVRVSLRSSFRVLGNLIKPKFHHQAQCSILLQKKYDKKHATHSYNSSCIITS